MKKIVLIGFLLRLFFIFLSFGVANYDLKSYYLIGELVSKKINIYPQFSSLHHPYFPFFLYIEGLAYFIGKNQLIVSLIIKLINIIFDLGNIYLIYLLTKNKNKTFLYAINPVSILVFSFHGQFDSIPIFFLLLSIYLINRKKELLSILIYSFSIMIKTWPALFIVNLYKRLNFKKNILFVLFFPILSVFLYLFIFRSSLFDILKTILNYQGLWGVWGITLFFTNIRLRWQKLITFLFIIFFILISFLKRKKSIINEIYFLLSFFIIFTTNFSIQYFSWYMPFLIIKKGKKSLFLIFLITAYLVFNYLSWIIKINDFIIFFTSFIIWFFLSLLILLDIKKIIALKQLK